MTYHPGVICDECSEYPIIGTRFVSKKVVDFDLCEHCVRSYPNPDDFHAVQQPRSVSEERATMLDDRSQVCAVTAHQAKEQISAMEGDPSHISSFYFYERNLDESKTAEQNAQEILEFLHDHPMITNLRLAIPFDNTVSNSGIIPVLTKGIANLPQIKHVDWSISGNWHSDDAGFPAEPAVAALAKLIADSTSLEGIFVHMPCKARDGETLLNALFLNKTLKYFRLEVRYHEDVVSDDSFQATAIRLLEDHPSLQKVFLSDASSDAFRRRQLSSPFQDFVQLSNIRRLSRWQQRWCEPNLSVRQRLELVQEIDQQLDSFSPALSLTGMYYVIRQWPQLWQH